MSSKSRHPTARKRGILSKPCSAPAPEQTQLCLNIFFSLAGVGDRVRGFQSPSLSHDCRGIKKYSPVTMWEHLYPLERDKTKNKASQIAVHEGGVKPQAPSSRTICRRWEMREARGNGKENLEGKRPTNNPPFASPNFTCSLAKVRPCIHTCQVQTRFGCPCRSKMLTLCFLFENNCRDQTQIERSGNIVLTLGYL